MNFIAAHASTLAARFLRAVRAAVHGPAGGGVAIGRAGAEASPAKAAFPVKGRLSAGLVCAGALWLALICCGMAMLHRYESISGPDLSPPERWPASSVFLQGGDRPTLLMFVHPECPCTRASLSELAVFMARSQGRVRTLVAVLDEDALPHEVTQTPIWKAAAAIPGVAVVRDRNGAEAAIFHAQTSGRTLLYSPDGKLHFCCGITIARGHEGANAGLSALTDLLDGSARPAPRTPVFGCPLFDSCPVSAPQKL